MSLYDFVIPRDERASREESRDLRFLVNKPAAAAPRLNKRDI
jgi:hypothetical protein